MKRLIAVSIVLAIALVSAPGTALSISGTFTDDDGSVHEPDIQAIAEIGVTNGCGPALFCPANTVTREQMASFLVRALELQPVATGPFTDLQPNVHLGDINALAAAGITLGCTTDRFCPADPVQRDQMASFLARAFSLTSGQPAGFSDVPATNPHGADIDAIAAAGITLGCGAAVYCPTDAVRRDQMASFLRRALGLEQSFVRLPLMEGLPLTCTKDGLVCTGSIAVAYRPTYRITEGLYQVLPASDAELSAVGSGSTSVQVTIDGAVVALERGEPTLSADRQTVNFEQLISLSPGSHAVEARWTLAGRLIQTIRLTIVVA